MSKIVNPRQPPFGSGNPAFLQQRPEGASQARATVRPSTPGGVPYEGRIRRNGEFPPASSTQIAVNLIGNATVDRKQTGFIELRLANVQSRFPFVVIADHHVQQFPAPHSRGEQQENGEACSLRAQRR